MLPYIVMAIVVVILLALAFFLGYQYRRSNAEKEIGSAEQEATRIVNEALKTAETKKREALMEAREEIYKERSEHEWHYRGLADALRELSDSFAFQEFERLINQVFAHGSH